MRVWMGPRLAIRKEEAPPELIDRIVRQLTIRNPEYERMLRLRRPTYYTPEHIALYEERGVWLLMPRGYALQLYDAMRGWGLEWELIDKRTRPSLPPLRPARDLRTYQAEAVTTAIAKKQGVLVAPCGAGKTEIGMGIAAALGGPTLWLCHTKDLLRQAADRAAAVLGLTGDDLGVIGGGLDRPGRVMTVGMVQSLANRDLGDLTPGVGVLILDECQHAPASTFAGVVGQFPAEYRFGLSATPDRRDGLTAVVYLTFGPVLWRLTEDPGNELAPPPLEYEAVRTGMAPEADPAVDWSAVVTQLTRLPERNTLIASRVADAALAGRHCLVLSERVEHCTTLEHMIRERGVEAEALHGGMPKTRREIILARARAGRLPVLIGTQLADEGLDIPVMDTLFLTCPTRGAVAGRGDGRVAQRVGRIMRAHPGKDRALVVDFIDAGDVFEGQYRSRKRVYRQRYGGTERPGG